MGIGWIGQGSNGVFTSESAGGIPSNETTIGEALEQAGYLTAAIGKVGGRESGAQDALDLLAGGVMH